MKFEFAKATDVTKLAFQCNPLYQNGGYTKVFLTQDVNDVHLLRVLPEYEKGDGIILEYDKIPNEKKGQALTMARAKRILTDDELENYDYACFDDMIEVLKEVDGGFGINY